MQLRISVMNSSDFVVTTRRTFLTYLGTLSLSACGMPFQTKGSDDNNDLLSSATQLGIEEMDEALEMLSSYGPSYRGGLSNHGPMTAEAFVSLGHQDSVVGWVENYRKRLEPRSAPSKRIDATTWREALGDVARNRDWVEWFSNELAESAWRDVVGLWVPRLAPGMAAAGLHGVIRVGHAVSSLAIKENALRRDELARALAYWASDFLLLPGKRTGSGKLSPSQALKVVERLPSELRASRGLITTELKDLRGFEPFASAIDLVDPTVGKPDFITELLGTFAGTFINTKSSSFEFLHAVTGAAAIAEILPYIKKEQKADLLAHTWQVTAGIYSRYSRQNLVADAEAGRKQSTDQLAKQAVASGDEHTIKLVAACKREWLRNSDPLLLAAAAKRIQQHR